MDGIGSSLTIPTRDGRISSLADGLARALRKYCDARKKHGLEALLLCKADLSAGPRESPAPKTEEGNARDRIQKEFKVKCPECGSRLVFEEGCSKCHGCGYTMC